MSGDDEYGDPIEQRLVAALEEFQLAHENDPSVTPESFAGRFPDLEQALLECLAPLNQFAARGEPAIEQKVNVGTSLPTQQTLGDFKLLRELGRGGMGIVYEAIQLTIGRKVAVKVLPFATVLDPQQVKRFQNEARAAGTLHHDHIVPVLSVGEERGVYYYAMRLVHGQSLGELLNERRKAVTAPLPADSLPKIRPDEESQVCSSTNRVQQLQISTDAELHANSSFRDMARVAAEVASALHHAHQNGILHRDIKPSNLLIDTEGKAWVTDFGLARLESQSELTRSGNLLGTLRYLAPEALRHSSCYVDHRSDIYALGLTLYESLALRPAFKNTNHDQLIHQILTTEPQSLRQLNPSIPLDLQTIVDKAIAKDPAERYDSADLLAEDLYCFLDSKPIKARSAGPIEKLAKWRRRHSQLVNAVVLTALLFVSLSFLLLWRENGRTKEALVIADQHAQQAEKNLDITLAMLDEVALGAIAEKEIYESDVNLKQQIVFAEKILSVYEQLHTEVSQSPQTQFALATACRRIARLNAAFGNPHRLRELMERAAILFSELCEQFPNNVIYQEEYANVLARLTTLSATEKAIEILEPLVSEGVATDRGLGHLINAYNNHMLNLTSNRRMLEAEQVFNKCLTLRSQLSQRDPECREIVEAVGFGHFIALRITQARLFEAETLAKQMLEVTKAATEREPSNTRQRFYHGRAMTRMVRVLKAKGELGKALELSREVVRIQEEVCSRFTNYELYARMYSWHGVLHVSLLRALELSKERQDYFEQFFNRLPRTRSLLRARGRIFEKDGQLEKAIRDYEESVELDPAYYYAVESLANALREAGENRQAFKFMDRALELNPTDTNMRFDRAQLAYALGDFETAIADAQLCIEENPQPKYCGFLAWAFLTGPETIRQPETALKLAEAAIRQRDTVAYRNTVAVAQFAVGNHEACRQHLEHLVGLGQDTLLTWILLARIELRAGKRESGLRWAEKARLGWSEYRGQDSFYSEAFGAMQRDFAN